MASIARGRLRVIGIGAVLAAVGAGACRDSGLPDRNLPLTDAMERPFRYGTYDNAGAVRPVTAAQREWVAAGPAQRIPDNLLVAVEAGSRDVFRLATEEAPYTRLYVRSGDMYVPMAPVR